MTENKTKGMRTFLLIWIGQVISMLGSGLIGFALSVWIYEQTGQATPFAMTALFSVLPRILLSPIAGAIADRWDRKKIMLISDSLSGLVTLATAFLLLTGNIQVWMIYLISFLSSVFNTFQQPAYSASIVMLVPKSQLTRAHSLIQMGAAVSELLTPLLAGILFTTIGLNGIIVIDLATYLFALVTLLLVSIPKPLPNVDQTQAKASIFENIKFGWRYLADRRGLLGLLFYFAAVNFFLNISGVMVGPLVLSFSDAAGLGIAQTALGAGMLIGSLVMSAWGGPKQKRIFAVITFIALASLGFSVAGFKASLLFTAAGMFVLMFFIPFASAISSAVFALKVAPEVQGRVFATRSMISQSMMPLAFILSGVLADKVFSPLLLEGGILADTFVGNWIGVGEGRGIGLMLVMSGLVLLLISLIAYANPRIRHLETNIPDADPEPQTTA
jgi:MFS family permease